MLCPTLTEKSLSPRRKPPTILLAHAAAMAAVVFWGGNWVSIKTAQAEADPLTVGLLRLLVASACCPLLLALGRQAPRLRRRDIPLVLVLGACGYSLTSISLPIGLQYISASMGSLVSPNGGLFIVLLAALILHEPLTARKLGGLIFAMTGLVVVAVLGNPNASFQMSSAVGILITATGPLCFAFYTVLGKGLIARYGPLNLTIYATLAGTLLFLPVIFVGALDSVERLSLKGWLGVLFVGGPGTAFSFVLWYYALRRVDASKLALYHYMVPLFGLLAAHFILGEAFTPFLLVGGALILAGVALANTDRRPA